MYDKTKVFPIREPEGGGGGGGDVTAAGNNTFTGVNTFENNVNLGKSDSIITVNGTLKDGGGNEYVTRTDYASSADVGVVKIGAGVSINSAGQLNTYQAPFVQIKAGENQYNVIASQRQHQSVFYGLSRAAGVNLASSTEETAPDGTNPGVYPKAAKTAIKNMLGISDVCIPGIGHDSIQQKITDPIKANDASGVKSAAFGSQCVASGRDAFAEGSTNVASGNYSHVEGFENSATQPAAHAEGQRTKSQGVASHAEGQNTTAHGQGAHAEGIEAWANENAAHAEGRETQATNFASHAEGYQTKALGGKSHTEGDRAVASGQSAHAEGDNTAASGQSAHAEGYQSIASGYASHAEGKSSAVGNYSHAGGWGSTAEQDCSFAHGREVQARSARSAAFGSGTIALANDQMVVGRFNNNMLIGSLFVVGDGTSDSQRSNAFEVLAGGSIKIGNTILTEAQLKALLALLN